MLLLLLLLLLAAAIPALTAGGGHHHHGQQPRSALLLHDELLPAQQHNNKPLPHQQSTATCADPTDCTDDLQKAINAAHHPTGPGALLVPQLAGGKPWIVRPIFLNVSDIHITFAPSVEILAMRDQFHGKHDCLFSASLVRNITLLGYGATWRMHKPDYQNKSIGHTPYSKAEWRHGLQLHDTADVTVKGLLITQTGGDGIDMGGVISGNVNTHVADCQLIDNHRQGMSIGSARDLLVERTLFANTSGTAPQAGVDLEPDEFRESLDNVSFVDCVSQFNAGNQFDVSLAQLNGSSKPVSILFKNCTVEGTALVGVSGFFIAGVHEGLQGSVTVVDSRVLNTQGPGAYLGDLISPGSFTVRFVNTSFDHVAIMPQWKAAHPLSILVGSNKAFQGAKATGGVDFVNCSVVDDCARPFMLIHAPKVAVTKISYSGVVHVTKPAYCNAAVSALSKTSISVHPTCGAATAPDKACQSLKTDDAIYAIAAAQAGGASINVVDFGADPHSHNDSTAAFNAAFKHAQALGNGIGGADDGAYLAPAIFVPVGNYIISGPINTTNNALIGEAGNTMIRQLNPKSPIFVNPSVWRWRLQSLSLVGGTNHVVLGNGDIDLSFITIDDCNFANASGTVLFMGPSIASAQVTVSRSVFSSNQQVVLNWCTSMTFSDVWIEGCGPANCSEDTALFENYGGLFIERMVGVPEARAGNRSRWIDNIGSEASISARDSRFGGEGGGMLVVLNRASFLCVPAVAPPHLCEAPPHRGSLPAGTHFTNVPQGSSILLDNCQIDSYGTVEPSASAWNSSIYLEEIPQVLIVRQSLGLAYSPSYGPPPHLSLVKVSPALDLDGPQLDWAARFPNTLRYSFGLNDWAPDAFESMPVQLQPYVADKVYGDGPPTAGVWRSRQVVYVRLNSTGVDNNVIGWRCVEGGKPGLWKPWTW